MMLKFSSRDDKGMTIGKWGCIFSIRFWRQYVSLVTSIGAIISLLLIFDRKISRCIIFIATTIVQQNYFF